MNFLAHCLIGSRAANDDAGTPSAESLLAGGFLGDFIKGRVPEEMPRDLALGVRLHRRVDAYSNQQPDIRTSCERFPPELRRIAPILVDILCDHLLAQRWQDFHAVGLEQFTETIYSQVAEHDDWLTDSGHQFLSYAREKDLLARYADWSVTSGAMHSITRRLKRTDLDPLLKDAVPPILDGLAADFERYFPDILNHARDWVATESNIDKTNTRS